MTRRLVWLVVIYDNVTEVERFIEVNDRIGDGQFGWAVCDNSPRRTERAFVADEVVTVVRPDNPGYLEGALLGLDAWVDKFGELPEWVAISNTDLDLMSGSPLPHLDRFDPDERLIIAPRITEGAEAMEKNPHLVRRRSLWRLRANKWLGATPTLAWLYLVASQARLRGRLMLRASAARRDPANSVSGAAAQEMYAPYGAVFFLSRGFLRTGALPRNVPLMTEEFFVGEAALRSSTPVKFEPGIHLHHSAHVTTGGKVSRQRARAISKAFKVMHAARAASGSSPQ